MKTPRILIIAGSDSGGGAGIQADIKTVTMLGGHAMTAITAITAQNTLGVTGVHPIPTEMVIAQMDAVLSDLGADAVKIGMIGSAETANAVADRLAGLDVPIVFDPVMVASSGAVLADEDTRKAFDRLFGLCTVATPNKMELEELSSTPFFDHRDESVGAARIMKRTGCPAILAKGGHWGDVVIDPPGQVLDMLYVMHTDVEWREWSWYAPRIESRNSHGTGCTLASAIATELARGADLQRAITTARTFVRLAMLEAPDLGSGHGPMGHHHVRLDVGVGPRLNQFSLPATDLPATRNFYRQLGLTPVVDSAEKDYLRFETEGGATLSLYGEGEGVYLEHDDLDAEVARLQALGVEFETLPEDQPWGWREAWLRDPNGNRICLYHAGEMRRFPPWRVKPD